MDEQINNKWKGMVDKWEDGKMNETVDGWMLNR